MAIWIPKLDGRGGPKYLQIVEAMAEDIAAGRLPAGAQLPPHRELAYQLGLSANTTSRAYTEAVKRALLRGEVGRGTFVRRPGSLPAPGLEGSLNRDTTGPVDLSRNLPLPGFAEPHIRRVLGELSGSKGLQALLDYQTHADIAQHGEAAEMWIDGRGLKADADHIVTTMGGQHGLLCALMALLRPGDLLLTETLTYSPVLAMAERFGVHTASVAMDREGVLPGAFADACTHARPKAFYLTPTLQAPTTLTLSAERRREIARIAEQNDVTLIEDDVFGPLKTDTPPPLASLAPDHCIYVTSLSKAIAPGLRVGFVRAPVRLAAALRNCVNLSVWMTPPVTLEIAARLIRDGTAEKLAGFQRDAARHRQALARTLLKDADLLADPQGLHLWLGLPAGWRADVFRATCARQGVLVSEGRSFTAKASDAPEAIRVCLSHEVSEARLEQGLRTVADILTLPPETSAVDL